MSLIVNSQMKLGLNLTLKRNKYVTTCKPNKLIRYLLENILRRHQVCSLTNIVCNKDGNNI